MRPGFLRFIRENRLDLVVAHNLLSLGYSIAGMLALVEAIRETGVRTVCHNHDFWWEDSGEVYPTCPEVVAFFEEHALPVAPNVFDFDQTSWAADAFNADFRDAIGLRPGDLFFLQATRILDRKGVELAIDVVAESNRPENRRRLEATPR